MPKLKTLHLAGLTLGVNALIILQGAVVRATGSGAGCGSHWPLCNGTVVPLAPSTETLVEYSHRLLSLAALVLGAWLLSRAFRTRRERPAQVDNTALVGHRKQRPPDRYLGHENLIPFS